MSIGKQRFKFGGTRIGYANQSFFKKIKDRLILVYWVQYDYMKIQFPCRYLSVTQIALKICWESQEKNLLKKQQLSYCKIIGGYKNETQGVVLYDQLKQTILRVNCS